MPVRPHIARRQRQTGGRLLGAEIGEPFQWLRRGQLRAHNPALLRQYLHRHQPGVFLEQQPGRRLFGLRRQHEGGADIGVASERNFRTHGKNSYLRIMRAIGRRQHEGGLRIIELAGNRLHLRSRQPAGVEHHGERIAAEGAVGEYIDGDVAALHVDTPVRHGRDIP